jgi:hypothetical protein
MPFITSSINATVSRQTSRRADQQCAAYAALMELPKDALALFANAIRFWARSSRKSDPKGPLSLLE